MQIILEGPDGSGKSTLASALSDTFGLGIIRGQGPEKRPGEMLERIAAYKKITNPAIFDRHPCISHTIYHSYTDKTVLPARATHWVYHRPATLIIHCVGSMQLDNHQHNEHDSLDHLVVLENHHRDIVMLYREWARYYAHLNYDFRSKHDPHTFCHSLKGLVNNEQ